MMKNSLEKCYFCKHEKCHYKEYYDQYLAAGIKTFNVGVCELYSKTNSKNSNKKDIKKPQQERLYWKEKEKEVDGDI